MNREKRKRRLQAKPASEKLETRWLMHTGFGPWGALRLLDRLEAQGDHRFDALYQRLSTKFDTWAVSHPAQAKLFGPIAAPVGVHAGSTTTSPPPGGASIHTTGGGSSRSPAPVIGSPPATGSPPITGDPPASGSPPGGSSPAGGIHPLIVPGDGIGWYQDCNCGGATANDVSPNPGAPALASGFPSSATGPPPSAPSPNPPAIASGGPMDSDASLITGEYLQSREVATYQSLDTQNGVDLQYSSLQADVLPIVTAVLTINDNNAANITSMNASLTVNGASQGAAVTYNVSGLLPGVVFLCQIQAVNAASYATGIYATTITLVKNYNTGLPKTDTFNGTLPIVNNTSSPYGAGWSIGGLEQITIGTPNQTLMISNGSLPAEEFTSTNGVNYAGSPNDPSTLTYNSGSSTYTRTFTDGTVVTFNSHGQEISAADRDGNTTSYTNAGTSPGSGLATITDPVGLVTTFTYSSGLLSSITDPASRVTTFAVSSGNLTRITDPTDATTTFGYNSSHEITSETDPDNYTATVVYDSFGRTSYETLFGGATVVSIKPAQEVGLMAPGGSTGQLSFPYQYKGTVTDPNGSTVTLAFDSLGGVTAETDGRGNTTTITLNSDDWPSVVKDPLGRVTTYQYDSYGDITKITQPDGASETLAYSDDFGIPTSITDFNGNTTTFTLDSHGDITEESDPDGDNEYFTYNSAGEMLTYETARGNTTSYAYDSLGRLTTITYPGTGSPTVHLGYNSAGDVTSETDEVGDTTTLTYDNDDRLLTSQNPVQAASGREITYAYDGDGNLISIVDADNNRTTYSYNARNELTGVTDALGKTTSYTYDAEGDLANVTDPLGNISTYTYDDDGNLITATDPLNNVTTYVYDADNELINVVDPRGNTTTYGYNSLGEETTVTLPGQSASMSYGYDEDGDLTSVTDQLGDKTVYTYNSMDWLATESVYPNGSTPETTTYAYDGDGDLISVTDGLGHTTSYAYDVNDQLISETDPSGGGTTTYGYDAAGRLVSLTDPDNNTTTWTYDQANDVATEVNPMGYTTSYSYDLMGNETSVRDPDGHTITYSYDGDYDVTGETWVNPSGGALNTITYTYNADGDMTQVTDNNTSYQYTYNGDNEMTSFSDTGTPGLPQVTLTYAYDPDGNETSVSDSLGGVVSYSYDSRDELTNETLSGTGLSPEAVPYNYDAAGRLTGLTRYSNLAETTEVAATSYTYDDANRMTGITDTNSSGTTLVSYAYTYDAADRVTQEVRVWDSGSLTDTLTYGYTNNDQLTSVSHTNSSFTNESFSYDANGNQTGTGYTTTAGNEQTASPGYTYAYDHDGNLITATQTSTGDYWTYSYDFRDRMTGAVEKTSGGTTLAQVTFTYDALDNRIGMDENGTQTWTLYDGNTPVMDFNGSGSLTMRYMWGPAGVLARQTSGGTVSWYLADRLGTVRDLINNSGSIIDHVDFSAFGTVLDESSPSSGDRFVGFAGLERDTFTGLNLAVEREENPGTGRWDSQDPLGFGAEDPNLYRYAGNAPTVGSDPSGLADDVTVLPNPYKKMPTFGTALRDPDLRKKMKSLQQAYKRGGENGPELGIWVLWNPKLRKIGWTTVGVQPIDHNHCGFTVPTIPGWVPIGTMHTHSGSLSASQDDVDNANKRRYPGVILWGPFYQGYGPWRGTGKGPINYQNPNPGNGKPNTAQGRSL